MPKNSRYYEQTSQFNPIRLDEINQLKLLRRIDKKFVMPVSNLEALLNSVKDHYQIMEIGGDRDFEYHTSYFDTTELNLYLNHQNQKLNRFKIRIRTYKISDKTFLEVKQKNNKGRTIKSRIEIDNKHKLNDAHYEFIESVVPLNGYKLEKSAENSFKRITLVSFETLERITIDYDLRFWTPDSIIELPYVSIVEVKRDRAGTTSPVVQTLKDFKVYPRGFSKYCMGLTYLYPNLKQNSFKKNKLFLKKLEYATTD